MKTALPVIFSFVFFIASPALALESPWVSSAEMQAKLMSPSSVAAGEKTLNAAIQIRHSAGWHSYWRSPGESGLAPRFDWAASKNIDTVNVSYPLPERFDEMGLTVFGYKDDVIFPLDVALKNPDEPATLAVKMDSMACKDICIPVSFTITLDIPKPDAENMQPSRNAQVIQFARTKVPSPENSRNLRIENAVMSKEAVVVNAYSSRGFDHSDMIVEIGEFALPAKPEITPDTADKNKAMIRVSIPQDLLEQKAEGATPFGDVPVIITLDNGRESIERRDLFSKTAAP